MQEITNQIQQALNWCPWATYNTWTMDLTSSRRKSGLIECKVCKPKNQGHKKTEGTTLYILGQRNQQTLIQYKP